MDLIALLKFGSQEHMEPLVKEGALYMRPISYFIDLEEGDDRRGDKYEALTAYHQGPGTSVTIDGKHELSFEAGTLKFLTIRNDDEKACNIFCLTAITPTYWQVDPKNDSLGDCCVLINRPGLFLERFRNAAKSMCAQLGTGPVEYVPPSYTGPMGLFKKFAEGYAHQNEVRCLVRPGSPDPITLKLGSLEDIAELGPTASINRVLAETVGKRLGHTLP